MCTVKNSDNILSKGETTRVPVVGAAEHTTVDEAAKEIVDSIYPDAEVICCSEKEQRWCSFLPSQGDRCFLVYKLGRGHSIPGGSY